MANQEKKYNFIIIAAVTIALIFSAVFLFQKSEKIEEKAISQPEEANQIAPTPASTEKNVAEKSIEIPVEEQGVAKNAFVPPLEKAKERITKKTFGQFITPQNSPVQPEKFRGYHAGTDFEIFPEELNMDVQVRAICDGKIALKKTATGYGGLLVQNCELDNQPITVIYGHLKLASITKIAGDSLTQGEVIGILGKAFSAETSGERKHLHLGIHKGAGVNILGYVQSKTELSGWVDPVENMSLKIFKTSDVLLY